METEAATTTMYLSENWLDQTTGGSTLSVYNNDAACLTYTYPWGYWYGGPARIRLTLSDVEHLRKCATKDKKLKAALQKIAPHVDVEVDF